jgi:transposase
MPAPVKMRKVHKYSNEFKITAIKLTSLPGTFIQDVARVLDIHPFMLSRWKKEYREGKIKGSGHPDIGKLAKMEEKVTELKRIRELETALKKAQIENDLLKKVTQFNLEQRRRSSPLLNGIIKSTDSLSSAGAMGSREAATTHGKKGR